MVSIFFISVEAKLKWASNTQLLKLFGPNFDECQMSDILFYRIKQL